MVTAKALHLAGARIDDMEELTAHGDDPVTRGVLRRGGADQSEVKRDGHIAALVHGERYIAVSAVTLVHGRLQGVNRISQMPGTGDQTQP